MVTSLRMATRTGLEPIDARALYGAALLLVYACVHELISIATGVPFDAWKWIGLPLFTLTLCSGSQDSVPHKLDVWRILIWGAALVVWLPTIVTASPFKQWIVLFALVFSKRPASSAAWLWCVAVLGLLAADLWHLSLTSSPLQYLLFIATVGLIGFLLNSARDRTGSTLQG
jgi:hypothetical protein